MIANNITNSTPSEATSGSVTEPCLPSVRRPRRHTHTVAINWGSPMVQGPASLSVASSTTVGRTFSTTATYGDNGTYAITVVVTDDDTGSAMASTQVVVRNVNPTAAINAPDFGDAGYQFWLNKLNLFNGNFLDAEMVKAFITSLEYRQRFGP